jgi:predicted aconitase
MIDYKMSLTPEEIKILNGEEGEAKRKMLETLVMYGDAFEAKRLVKVTHNQGHLVTSFGIPLLKPVYSCFDELIKENLKVEGGFTMDPRPLDYKNVKCSPIEKLVFNTLLYGKQKLYEEQLIKLGLTDKKSFSCTSYLPECDNTPKMGDILSWSESSAVNFANSVLGAKCNRNSGMVDIFGSILGVVPEFGFLLDENRKATWIIDVKTTKKPEAQILGSAIGIKVMDAVPYIKGLDKFLGTELNPETIAYLKDFGAATASNGAVGLYHIDKITPEAKEQGEKLIKEGANIYVIDDAELERVYNSYPIMWKNKEKKANICFIGCPHLNYFQLLDWHDRLESALEGKKRKKVTCHVVFNAAPKVVEHFKNEHPDLYKDFYKMGASISSICPLMYTNNPLTHKKAIITNSNKLRTYSMARYFKDEKILDIITGGKY